MELNRKILRTGIIIISFSIIISLGFIMAIKLDRPVFLKSYTESMIFASEPSYRGSEFVLKYITNVSDNRKVIDIYFDEYPDLVLYAGKSSSRVDMFPMIPQYNYSKEEIYGRYVIKNLYVKIDGKNLGEFDEVELNNAKITFDNGESINADLGRIIFYNYSPYKEEHFDFSRSRSSTDGTSSTEMGVTEDIIIANLDSPLLKDIDDLIEIKIGETNYKDISEIQYKSGETIRINSRLEYPRDILRKYSLYYLEPKVYYKDSNGNSFYRRIRNIEYVNYDYEIWGLVKYLKARGEL